MCSAIPLPLEWESLPLQQDERMWLKEDWPPHSANLGATGLEVLVLGKQGPGSKKTVKGPLDYELQLFPGHCGPVEQQAKKKVTL